MGINNQTVHKQKLQPPIDLHDQYRCSYKKLSENQNYLNQLLIQSAQFGTNLQKMFPNASNSFKHYCEMILYLRKYEPHITTNTIAHQNIGKTTLIDRFFMLCLGIYNYKEYNAKKLNIDELDQLLIQYMNLFIKNPQKGHINKILKFININDDIISVQQFASSFRQQFPHVQKYLKDYYKAKFIQLKNSVLLLNRFNSNIVSNDAVLLSLKLVQISSLNVVQIYDSEKCGVGFHSIEKTLLGYTGPWLLLIQHSQKDLNNQRQKYIFGTYQNGPIKDLNCHQGDLTGFMFSIEPKIRFMTTEKGDGGSYYFHINNIPQEVSKRRKGFGFGGNKNKQDYRSTVFNGDDPTYGYGTLAGPGTEVLSIRRMQIWALGTELNLEDQKNYWIQRNQQIQKRRKVNKKDFIDSNAGLFFENTFAHRDQVIGEIERTEKKKQENQ